MSIQVVSENIILKNKNGKKVKAVLKVKQICFDPLLWSAIKEYAGYSNDFPTDLPYYQRMLGWSVNLSQTRTKWRRVNSLTDYIDKLWDITWMYELSVRDAFAPRKYKSLEQARREWDAKYGEGDFDNDLGY
jgi:hypothetical protein